MHGVNLVESVCGRPETEHVDSHLRTQIGGCCPSCGSIGFRCNTYRTIMASDGERWKAQQYEQLLGNLLYVEAIEPAFVKQTVLAYAQNSKRGIAGLADRSGMPKSRLWRWLQTPPARLSLGGYTKLAAAEGWSLVGLLSADLVRVGDAVQIVIPRGRRIRQRIDPEAIRSRLVQAIEKPVSLGCIANDLGVSRALLSRQYKELSLEVSQKLSSLRRGAIQDVRDRALEDAESTLLKLWAAGKSVTLRNAREITGSSWLPASLRSRIFGQLRTEFGANAMYLPAINAFGEEMLSAIDSCRKKIRQKINPILVSTGTTLAFTQ